MKYLFLLMLIAIYNCNYQTKYSDSNHSLRKDSLSKSESHSLYHIANDISIILPEIGDTATYTKGEFNKIVDKHPELTTSAIEDPDATFHCRGDDDFNSEAGQDSYYVLYSYFLKQKNGESKYSELRKSLILIFENINNLFGQLQHGGTFFGHQNWRIMGYAEYSVYLFKINQQEISNIDITKQRELYIKSLRQLIDDNIKTDFDVPLEHKNEYKQKLNEIVGELEKLISNVFLLRRAQEFQHEHYEYYN